MDQRDKQKIIGFVNHLLGIPNISSEPLAIREGMIISFITQNLNQIRKTLNSPQFFPHYKPEEILKHILQILRHMILLQITPQIEEWLNNRMDLKTVQKLFPSRDMGEEDYKSLLLKYVNKILLSGDARYNFNSVINIFQYNILERYIPEIFERRGSIFNEIRRVEKNPLELEEYIEYSKIVFLVRNTACVHIPMTTGLGRVNVNINKIKKFSIPLLKFLGRQEQLIMSDLPFMTKQAISSAIKSNLKERSTEKEDASARLFYILASRYQEYKHYKKIDRGAETMDKSWFSIARRNCKHYGFNERMLDELYLIAGDNMW